MKKGAMLYQGKAKQVFATDDSDKVIMVFSDDATAFDGAKKGQIGNKGVINCTVSRHLFTLLETYGIPTHLIDCPAKNEMLVKKVSIIPVEVVIRNIAAGSICRRLGVEEGMRLKHPIYEFFYKNDELHDPLITEEHIRVFDWATPEEMVFMRETAFKVNDILFAAMDKVGITLVDYKLEFGRTADGKVVLADEITPDGCRLWDKQTGKKLDKDRFRRDLGGVEEAYSEAETRLLSIPIPA